MHQTFGPPPDGATPLLLTHGFSASSAMWQPNIEVLAAARPVITWGTCAATAAATHRTIRRATPAEACVADMAALLDACGIARVVAGELSLGGYLSLEFCLAYPDRVAGLVLCDTGPGYRRDDARTQWNDRAIAIAERLERDSSRGLALAARGMLTQCDARVIDALPAITIPALVLVGARDQDYLGAAEYMAARLPRAVHAAIPDACRRTQRRPAGSVQPAGARLPGPARSPLSTPASANRVISSSVRPASASTSRVCCPASGAGRRTAAGVAENRVGGGITLYRPARGCSASGSASMSSSRPVRRGGRNPGVREERQPLRGVFVATAGRAWHSRSPAPATARGWTVWGPRPARRGPRRAAAPPSARPRCGCTAIQPSAVRSAPRSGVRIRW